MNERQLFVGACKASRQIGILFSQNADDCRLVAGYNLNIA